MSVYKAVTSPARLALNYCGKWFNYDPWTSIVFLILCAGVFNLFFILAAGLSDNWDTYVKSSAIAVPTAFENIILVVFVFLLLIWLLNEVALFWAMFVFFVGSFSAKPSEQGDGYKLYERYIKAAIGGGD